jgi:Asp-tRNA(Asn)/Glu-tRNA(Gln) amidotransferase B subunit
MDLDEVVDQTMQDHPELVKRARETQSRTVERARELLAVILKRRQGHANPVEVVSLIEERLGRS